MTIDELRDDMQAGFANIRIELRGEIKASAAELQAEMRLEGETTRRRFDLVAEEFREYTKALADGTARNTERLNDHERRITQIERPGR